MKFRQKLTITINVIGRLFDTNEHE